MDWLSEFVMKYLNFTGKCFRHCDKSTTMRLISEDPDRIVGAYVCPDGIVSQVVHFSPKADLKWFQEFLTRQVGGGNLNQRDVRIASRHGWELGEGALEILQGKLGEAASIKEVYWTRYPQTEMEKQKAVSLCIGIDSKPGCMKLFMHDRNYSAKLCPSCKAKYSV